MLGIKRRDFITLLGGAAVTWPLGVHAQQAKMPTIGYLNAASPVEYTERTGAFLQGLRDNGFVDGSNVVIDYRWAEGQYDRLPATAAELVRRQVAVIVTGGMPSAVAAKTATTTIPIVFALGADPVKLGLVPSLARPGGNITGVTNMGAELLPKLLELLHEAAPALVIFGILVNPTNPNAEAVAKDVQAAGRTLGLQINVLQASTDRDMEAVFASLAQRRMGGLVISPDPFFNSRRVQLGALASSHAVPAIYNLRDYVAAGGLMSYGDKESLADFYRRAGNYTGRILRGERPQDLPVQQSSKIELVINLKAAKALGLTVPLTLLALANEVIE